ncbi:MAG: hypothetical protein ACRCSN_03695 [Dermatophilaceae bacterium]
MTDTLARPERADGARPPHLTTSGVTTSGVTTGGVVTDCRTTDGAATGATGTGDHTVIEPGMRGSAAAWDAWAARVDGERDIAMVLDALPRVHALMGAYPAAPLHPLAPVDGVLAAPGGVVGPFADLDRTGRPGRLGRLGTGRHFIRVTDHEQPTSWGRLRLVLLVAAALWCASNTTTLVDALIGG